MNYLDIGQTSFQNLFFNFLLMEYKIEFFPVLLILIWDFLPFGAIIRLIFRISKTIFLLYYLHTLVYTNF